MRPTLLLLLLAALLTACASASPNIVQPVSIQPAAPTTSPAPDPGTLTPVAATTTAASSATATPAAPTLPTGTPAGTASSRRLTPVGTAHATVERGLLAPGFSLTVYGAVPAPASLAFGPDGALYVGSTNSFVYVLRHPDVHHRAQDRQIFATDVPMPLGLAWLGNELYVSYQDNVIAVSDPTGSGTAGRRRTVLTGLPSDGLHSNDSLAFGADGYFYLGQGAPCDHCRAPDPRSGTILRFRPDGSHFGIFATGLRNPYGLAFNAAGDLLATDNGRDDLGMAAPPEVLHWIRPAFNYGWPDCWPGSALPFCARQVSPAVTFTPHTSADGLAFYTGRQFPPEYFDNAFVAVLGTIYLKPSDTERGVARVRLSKTGGAYTGRAEWFLYLPDGRPVAVTVGPDGGLYVADYENGLIYRIVWAGGQ